MLIGRDIARRLQLAAVVLAVLAAAGWGAWLGERHRGGAASPLDRLEAVTLDWRQTLAGPRPPPDDVVIVAIDDAAIAELGGFPIRRDRLAGLVETLTAAGARRSRSICCCSRPALAPPTSGSPRRSRPGRR